MTRETIRTSNEAVGGAESGAARLWLADERDRQLTARSAHDRRRQTTAAVDTDA